MRVLQYSGGIDSLAVLFFMRPEWEDITVLWCNTGMSYPDTEDRMDKVRAMVPYFHEVKSDKKAWEAQNGIAVDVCPERYTLLGTAIHDLKQKQLYTSYLRCCSANIWVPLDSASRALGATVIYRGQKRTDEGKAPIKSGHVDATGIRYEFPIEDWSRDKVMEYCLKVCPDLVPQHYFRGEVSGHDCWDCIAYLYENQRRIPNLPIFKREIVLQRLRDYNEVLMKELGPLKEIL